MNPFLKTYDVISQLLSCLFTPSEYHKPIDDDYNQFTKYTEKNYLDILPYIFPMFLVKTLKLKYEEDYKRKLNFACHRLINYLNRKEDAGHLLLYEIATIFFNKETVKTEKREMKEILKIDKVLSRKRKYTKEMKQRLKVLEAKYK